MARFKADDVNRYGSNGGGGYFSLQNDMETAQVRFLYNDANDVEGFVVHEVELGDKKRYVNCLRDYNSPVDDCPFCKAKKYQLVKMFIPLYNLDEDKVQIWDRGKTFFSKMSGICSRYDKHPIVSQVFEVERHGKPRDTSTTYEIFKIEGEPDDVKLEDFDMPKILGGLVLDKNYDDMEFYLDNGYFPPEDEDEGVSRRRSGSAREDSRDDDRDDGNSSGRRERPGRRTPSRGRKEGF